MLIQLLRMLILPDLGINSLPLPSRLSPGILTPSRGLSLRSAPWGFEWTQLPLRGSGGVEGPEGAVPCRTKQAVSLGNRKRQAVGGRAELDGVFPPQAGSLAPRSSSKHPKRNLKELWGPMKLWAPKRSVTSLFPLLSPFSLLPFPPQVH